MKRVVNIILVLMLFCITLFTACDTESDNLNGAVDTSAGGIISGFEDYNDLVHMRILNNFGSIKQYSKSNPEHQRYWEYITEGDKGLYIEAQGDYLLSGKPTMVIDTKLSKVKDSLFGRYEKFDFSDVEKVLLDVYNDNDFAANVYFQYQTQTTKVNKLTSPIKVSIPANSFKTCEFVIDRNFVSQLLNIDLVTQIRLSFDNETEYLQPRRKFLIDNLRFSATDEPIDHSVKARKDNEIESFDRAEYLSVWSNFASEIFFPSSLAFNDDERFIKSGTGSFKMSNMPMARQEPLSAMGWAIKPPLNDLTGYDFIEFWLLNTHYEDIFVNWYIYTLETGWTCDVHPDQVVDGKCSIRSNVAKDGYVYPKQHYTDPYVHMTLPAAVNHEYTWHQVRIPVDILTKWSIDIKNFDYFAIVAEGVNNTVPVDIYIDEFWAGNY